jgi:hypothetical protein
MNNGVIYYRKGIIMRIVFFNISYMNYYKGKKGDQMFGSFRYVTDTNNGGEKHNFEPLKIDGKEVCYGFVEPGYTKGGYENGKQRQIHIEKIKNAGNAKEKLDDVLVIWCAKIPTLGRTVIVGWYKNATVYRYVNSLPYDKETDRGLPEFGYLYNAIADKSNCTLLPSEERIKIKWIAHRNRQNPDKFGFGQSNMWYAREDNAQDYVSNLVEQIDSYYGDNWV